DVAYPHLVYRIQSARWHGAVSHARDDARQEKELAGHFEIVDIWDRDLWRDPDGVVATILAARRRAWARSVGRKWRRRRHFRPTERLISRAWSCRPPSASASTPGPGRGSRGHRRRRPSGVGRRRMARRTPPSLRAGCRTAWPTGRGRSSTSPPRTPAAPR